MSRRRRQRRQHAPPEINITAFLNLMVVLIPFLLLTAAFNQLNMLELYLPEVGAPAAEEKAAPELELVLRTGGMTLKDRKNRRTYLESEILEDGGYDYQALTDALPPIKARHPDLKAITLLSEPGIPYERLIRVMEAVRSGQRIQAGQVQVFELFPDIALGDAPDGKG